MYRYSIVTALVLALTACGGDGPNPPPPGGSNPPGGTTTPPAGASTDLSGNPVTTQAGSVGSTGGHFDMSGVVSVDFPSGAFPDSTKVTAYPDASQEMLDTFDSGAGIFQFEHKDNKGVVLLMSALPTSTDGSAAVRVPVSDALAVAIQGGAIPNLLYYTATPQDPDENGADFGQFNAVADPTFDVATKSIVGTIPMSAFFGNLKSAAVFFAAATQGSLATLTQTTASPAGYKSIQQSISASPLAEGVLLNPLDSVPLTITGYFGELRGKGKHQGLDLRTGGEIPLYAPGKGSIISVQLASCVLAPDENNLVCTKTNNEPILTVIYRLDSGTSFAFRHITYGSVTKTATCPIGLADKFEIGQRRVYMNANPSNTCRFEAGDLIARTGKSGTEDHHLHAELYRRDDVALAQNWADRRFMLPAFANLKVTSFEAGELSLTDTSVSSQKAFSANNVDLGVPAVHLSASPYSETSPADLPIRITLHDSKDAIISAKRGNSLGAVIPVTADWRNKSSDTAKRGIAIALKATTSNEAVATVVPNSMTTISGFVHNDGAIIVRPVSNGAAVINVTLTYPARLPDVSWPNDDFSQSSNASDSAVLATVAIPVTVKAGVVSITWPDTTPGWNGLPATVTLSNLVPSSTLQFQTTGANCPERGSPLFSGATMPDAAFFAAKSVIGMPSRVSGPAINRNPCSSFFAYQWIPQADPTLPKRVRIWLNATGRGVSFSTGNPDWEYQIRYDSGDPTTNAPAVAQLGVVPNSGTFVKDAESAAATIQFGAAASPLP